jgi:hypothetical protein
VKRRIGPCLIADDAYDERRAHVEVARIVAEHVTRSANVERAEQEGRWRGVTFREVARAYLRWLEDVRGAKPSTLRDHGYVLESQAFRTSTVPV